MINDFLPYYFALIVGSLSIRDEFHLESSAQLSNRSSDIRFAYSFCKSRLTRRFHSFLITIQPAAGEKRARL